MDLMISESLGFNDTYALAVKESFRAGSMSLHTIGDLEADRRPSVRAAFSYEFMDRKDGYPGLGRQLSLAFDPQKVNRMEHTLTFQAIDQNAVDLIDVYSTDAKIKKLHLRVLKDDRDYFPGVSGGVGGAHSLRRSSIRASGRRCWQLRGPDQRDRPCST